MTSGKDFGLARVRLVVAAGAALMLAPLAALAQGQTAPPPTAGGPQAALAAGAITFYACYVKTSGTVYRIKDDQVTSLTLPQNPKLGMPIGVESDAQGRLLVVDSQSSSVLAYEITEAPSVLSSGGGAPSGAAANPPGGAPAGEAP